MDTPQEPLEDRIRASEPHSARVWNYWLGGKDNYPADRRLGDMITQMVPAMPRNAREQRYFLHRVVRYLVGEAGIRQFLDIGTGLPTHDNTHEVAQRTAPECRIVYVDNDPLVLVHAQALLTSDPEGACGYIDADVRDPGKILREAGRTLDFSQPVALTMLGIIGQVADQDDPKSIIDRLLRDLPSGSYLALCDGVNTDKALTEANRVANQNRTDPYHLRSPDQLTDFFDGLELVEPGVVPMPEWRPEIAEIDTGSESHGYGGVGRKA